MAKRLFVVSSLRLAVISVTLFSSPKRKRVLLLIQRADRRSRDLHSGNTLLPSSSRRLKDREFAGWQIATGVGRAEESIVFADALRTRSMERGRA
jgi:hypothetical protein